MRRRSEHEDQGFTLVELLVVVLIIGLLAAIAVPTLLSQRDRAFHAAMTTDLRDAVTAEYAFYSAHDAWTTDSTVLVDEGYRTSSSVTPVHVKIAGATFLACVKHAAVQDWLVFDSATGDTSTSPTDCAA